MTIRRNISAQSGLIRWFVIVSIALSLVLVPVLESFADSCGDHCEESCETCGECVSCFPTLYMMAGGEFNYHLAHPELSWSVQSLALIRASALANAIDHPPQNPQ